MCDDKNALDNAISELEEEVERLILETNLLLSDKCTLQDQLKKTQEEAMMFQKENERLKEDLDHWRDLARSLQYDSWEYK